MPIMYVSRPAHPVPWREKVGGEGCDFGNLILPIVSGLLVPDPWAHFALGSLSWAL